MTFASRAWRAVETTDLVGSVYRLTVTGEVEVRRTNETPILSEAQPQGINPEILILALKVESSGGLGGDIVFWKPVSFTREISPREFHQVTITGETQEQTIEVEHILS